MKEEYCNYTAGKVYALLYTLVPVLSGRGTARVASWTGDVKRSWLTLPVGLDLLASCTFHDFHGFMVTPVEVSLVYSKAV